MLGILKTKTKRFNFKTQEIILKRINQNYVKPIGYT